MKKLELNEKISKLNMNILNETNSGDIGQFPEMIKPLLYKVYTESLVSELADIQQLTSPTGRIFTLFSNYGGQDADELNAANSSVLVVSNGVGYAVDQVITTTTGNGTIVYLEGNNFLVKINSGYFTKTQTLDTTAITVDDVISNRNYVRKVFKNYSGPFTTANGEINLPLNIDHEVRGSTIEVKTRKIKSKVTQEVIQDIKAQFGEDLSKDILANEFGSEMIQAIDIEIINYLKTIATPISDVVLANSYAITGGSLGDVGADIYANIYKLTVDIMRNTKRRKNFFVIADAATVGLMMASPLFIKPEGSSTNSYFMGRVGGSYNLYLDPYSTDNYVLVGYKNENSDEMGDSGLIFAPYMSTIWDTTEPETGKAIFFQAIRYGYTANPQDTTTGNADSIFFKMFNVNISGLSNYTNL
jgi:hypothetical protein